MSTNPIVAATDVIVGALVPVALAAEPEATLLALALANVDPVALATEITELEADAALTLTATSHDEFCDALKAWGRDLTDIAELLLASVVSTTRPSRDLLQSLVIELVTWKFPRLAALLSAAGVFDHDVGLGPVFDWAALRDFLVSTPDLVSEAFWDELLAGTPLDDVAGRTPAVVLALLLVAPDTIAALGRGGLHVAGLPAPPAPPGASAEWAELRARTGDWLAVTHPVVTVDGRLRRAPLTELASGFQPEQAVTLALRSRRRPVDGRTVTDFEAWVHPQDDVARLELDVAAGFVAALEPGVRVGFGHDGDTGTWNAAIEPRPGSPDADTAVISVDKRDVVDGVERPDVVIGPPDHTQLIVRDLGARLTLRAEGEPSVELVVRAEGVGLVFTNKWFRALGVTGGGLRIDADLEARLSEIGGLSLAADGVLEIRRPWGRSKSLAGFTLTIHSYVVRLAVRADGDGLNARVELRPHWSLTRDAATFVMDGAGGWLGWWADAEGDDKHCIGLLAPTGIGFQWKRGGFAAGGFFEYVGGPSERWGGLAWLKVEAWGVSITAFGVHELAGAVTDAQRPRTFVVVLGATFSPGVAIGPGLIWFGAGGVYAHDRRADIEALRGRLASGAISNVLFADDPVRNAPVILGDLRVLFPPQPGTHILGLTVQAGWVPLLDDYFVRVALGVLLEFRDGLRKVVILGTLRIRPPKLEKVLDIEIDAVGVIDIDRQTLEIDATIRRGLALGVFKLTGDGGVRAKIGTGGHLAATIGGFHPDYDPAPAVFPSLRRVKFTFYKEDLPGPIDELSASGYLAVTSTTLQAGLELKAAIKSGNWRIVGTIGGDALIRLPFDFDVSLHGGVHVTYRGRNLIGVSFKGGISGPSPIVLRGEVCVSLLLFDACWGDSIELGFGDNIRPPAFETLVPMLGEELARPDNLHVATPDDGLVIGSGREGGARPVLTPLGAPVWTQHRVPLALAVETFESGSLDAPQRLEVVASRPTSPVHDLFSPGSFVELTDAEAMALPAFEQHQSGISISVEPSRSAPVVTSVQVEEIRLPARRRLVDLGNIPIHVLEQAAAVDTPPTLPTRPGRFTVSGGRFDVVDGAGDVTAGLSAVQATVAARAGAASVRHPTDELVVL